MKRFLLCILSVFIFITPAWSQHKKMVDVPLSKLASNAFPLVPIRDLQYIPPDSLHFCDSVDVKSGPASPTSAWWAQTSAYYKVHTSGVIDTVEIVGQIIVPPRYITFTSYSGLSITLRDTARSANGAWCSIFVRPALPADTVSLMAAGLLTYSPGDIVRIRGYVDEYPVSSFASYTEFVPLASTFVADPNRSPMTQCIEYIDTKPVPPPDIVTPIQFMKGAYTSSGTNIQYSTGEQWEDCYVVLTDLTVSSIVNNTNGTFSMQDALGNEIADMDGSKWFTTRQGNASGSLVPYRDPASTYALPSVGQVIDTIRGYIATNSGSDANRGYRIYPVFRNDLIYTVGKVHPAINTHRRNPVALKSTDSASVAVKSYKLGSYGLKTVQMFYSLNNGTWNTVTMNGPNLADSTWNAVIPRQANGTSVKYFFTSTDSSGLKTNYASAARGTSGVDTSQGLFFYTVNDNPLKIYDIQYTPYSNGMSGVIGDTAIVNGVVTADTSTLSVAANGTTPWYIQNGNLRWNGLWVYGTDTTLYKLRVGDSVSVKGVVQENLDGLTGQVATVTRLGNAVSLSKFASGKALPSPIVLQTGNIGTASNGSINAEPYEGMIVRFNTVTVSQIGVTFSDSTEYAVDDGSGQVIIRGSDGKNKYSSLRADASSKTIVKVNDKFSYIQGIVYCSFNQYKLVPRDNNDYGTYAPAVGVARDPNSIPQNFSLEQNYPNPFNPSTTIKYSLPIGGIVALKIFNILGQEVATLVNGYQSAGHYTAQFNAAHLSSGVYLYRLQSASGSLVNKMLLIK